jgi:hypothetical protein
MNRFNPWRGAAVSLALVSGFVACTANDRPFVDPNPGVIASPDSGTDEAAPPACAGRRCSRDLHSVVDGCTDQNLETCPAAQGCAAGHCVSACDSAAASQGSIGCSFWTVPPDVGTESRTSCYAAFVANTWSTPVTVTAEYGSSALDISKSVYRASTAADGTIAYDQLTGTIPPGEVGIVFLAQGEPAVGTNWIGCPTGVNVAFHGSTITEHKSSVYAAFHLATDLPVSAYSIYPYGGAKSYIPAATLLIPSASWGTSYFLIDGWPATSGALQFIQIVAQQDDTQIKMRPPVDIKDGVGVNGSPRGFVGTWTLKRGQVLELSQVSSLAGTPVETNHPVAVFGGSQCVDVPADSAACDTLQQQIPPVQQWASKYSAVPYESRRIAVQPPLAEEVIWKVVAARDGTTLTYDPAPPRDAPTTLAAGQIATFTSAAPFTVKSQGNEYPFYVAVYMTGATKYGTQGDPDFVNVIPDEQFLDHYVFFVDYTYADSNLTFVRRKDENGFHDVKLDCAGTITGWKPLGQDGSIEYAWVDLTRNRAGVKYPAGTCSYGRHEASSDGAFGLYVWGEDFCASYGFPAGAGSRPTSPYKVDLR